MSYINNLLKLASRFEWKVKLAQSESDLIRDSRKSIAQEDVETEDFRATFLSDFNSYTEIVSYIITFYPKKRKNNLGIQLGLDIPEKDSLGLQEDYNIIMNYLLNNSKIKNNIKLYNFILNNKEFESALLNLLATTEKAREHDFVYAPYDALY